MEFCAGGTLSMYIRDVIKGKLPEKTVNSFMYEITKGLKYMSEKSLIHRDLKPQNILITDNNDPHIKIADFGFARYLLGNDLAETQCGKFFKS
jgi:serine/threonine protein kinase